MRGLFLAGWGFGCWLEIQGGDVGGRAVGFGFGSKNAVGIVDDGGAVEIWAGGFSDGFPGCVNAFEFLGVEGNSKPSVRGGGGFAVKALDVLQGGGGKSAFGKP